MKQTKDPDQQAVYQRLYLITNTKNLTPAYMIKFIVYPSAEKMVPQSISQQMMESSSRNPKSILDQSKVCAKCEIAFKPKDVEHNELVFSYHDSVWLCKHKCGFEWQVRKRI